MKVFNELVFDESIKGTADEWYTPAEYNDLLGRPDAVDFMLHVSQVGGTNPTLTVAIEDSADGRHWRTLGHIAQNADIDTTTIFRAAAKEYLSFVRLKTTLGVADAECRVKLYATGRNA